MLTQFVCLEFSGVIFTSFSVVNFKGTSTVAPDGFVTRAVASASVTALNPLSLMSATMRPVSSLHKHPVGADLRLQRRIAYQIAQHLPPKRFMSGAL